MHWQTKNNIDFFPRQEHTKFENLPSGIYLPSANGMGEAYLSKIEENTDLVKFEDSIIDEIVKEISSFWKKEELFRRNNFTFRRGILFYGPHGTGKSCAIKMILNDVVAAGGIGVLCKNYNVFTANMGSFRNVQPETPIVVVMEDIDHLLEYYDESDILNMLDGIGGYDKVVFLATTNNIGALAGRIKDRPSRFDRCVEIGYPSEKVRFAYLQHLINQSEDFSQLPIDVWSKDSEGLSLAHLKELFISVAFFDTDYREAIVRLQNMGDEIEGEE